MNGLALRWPLRPGRRLLPGEAPRVVTRALVGVGLLFLVGAMGTILAGSSRRTGTAAPLLAIVSAAAWYLSSHGLRALRLGMLLGGRVRRLRALAAGHCFGAGVSALLPLKLGEAYRVWALGRQTLRWTDALVATWVERTFDAVALAAMLLCATAAVPTAWPLLRPAAILTVTFAALSCACFAAVSDGCSLFKLFLIRRYTHRRVIQALGAIERVQATVGIAPQLLRHRCVPVALLTVAIWGCELAALLCALSGGRARGEIMAAMLLVVAKLLAPISAFTAVFSRSGEALDLGLGGAATGRDASACMLLAQLPMAVAALVAGAWLWRHPRARPG